MKLGQWNLLKVLREAPQGFYLGTEDDSVLLPRKWAPENLQIVDEISVFIYTDSEDRPIATTLKPKVEADQFAVLEVKEIADFGAFLDWGIEKDLLLPDNEQADAVKVGQSYPVFVFVDDHTHRLVASARVDDFYVDEHDFEEDQKVTILPLRKSELGYVCAIEHLTEGLLFHSDVHQEILIGHELTAYVKKVREDGKIDLSIHAPGYEKVENAGDGILGYLQRENGFMPFTDKSSPEVIKRAFGMSKKVFKKSLGLLYKQRLVELKDDGVYLIK